MSVNKLAAAGFFFTNRGEVVRCAFYGVEVEQWAEGDYVFKDHQRWSPSCAFVKRLFVGNIPAPPKTSQQQPSSRNEVCGFNIEYTLKTSRTEGCRYIFTFIYLCPPVYNYNSTLIIISFAATKFREHNALQWDGLMYPYYSSYHARMQSFTTWPTAYKQKPENLSGACFFPTGELLHI